MSSYYDTMQVCKKWGHKITDFLDSYPNHGQDFCEKCGSPTVFKCEHCNSRIKGYYHVSGVIGGSGPAVPLNCHKCGRGYPWRSNLLTKNRLIAAMAPLKYVVDSVVGIFKK